MSDARDQQNTFDVECPHCHKQFRSTLLEPNSPRHAGFKCPHCRLFVAYDRTAETNPG